MSDVDGTSISHGSGEGEENLLRVRRTGSGIKLNGMEELIRDFETFKISAMVRLYVIIV